MAAFHRDSRCPPFAQNAKDGAPSFLVIRGFTTWSFDLIIGLESCRDPSLGVARGRATPLTQDDNYRMFFVAIWARLVLGYSYRVNVGCVT